MEMAQTELTVTQTIHKFSDQNSKWTLINLNYLIKSSVRTFDLSSTLIVYIIIITVYKNIEKRLLSIPHGRANIFTHPRFNCFVFQYYSKT